MTKNEAVKYLESLKTICQDAEKWADFSKECEALNISITALRGPTREQVKKAWGGYRGACGVCLGDHPVGYGSAKKYGGFAVDLNGQNLHFLGNRIHVNFCPMCGRPLTDEAVDIVMKRLEGLHENNG